MLCVGRNERIGKIQWREINKPSLFESGNFKTAFIVT